MRRASAARVAVWALGLCASLAVSAQDHHEDQEGVRDLIHEDGTPAAEFLTCNKAAWRVHGQYLVVLRQGSQVPGDPHVRRTIRRLRAAAARRGWDLERRGWDPERRGGDPERRGWDPERRGWDLEILQTFSGALQGFLVKMSSDVLHLAVKLPEVHYIEEDSSIFAQSAPWNLQRLLQPHGGTSAENGTYRPPNDGAMAAVYLMDGGVQISHREIEGRVLVTDFNNVPEEDGVRVHRQASQCDSHGTHVAGVVSGSDSGVARGAGVNLVRVLNCQGRGTVSGALAGMAYIRATLLSRPAAAVVVLLPFVGGFSRSLNAACRDMVANGAVVVAAAGNYRDDACLYSPASEAEVITVGSINSADQLMSQGVGGTNFGRCVDLFAPGDDIVSASSDCSTCFTSRSGTSQAAAHAAGVAAVILSSNQNAAPVQVLQMMLHYSVSDTIDFLSLSDTRRLVTPNLVAAMAPANGTSGGLLCRSVWSERSGVTSTTDAAVSRCRQGEEMMSCSGYAPNGDHVGETITVTGGQMECVAHDASGVKGVFAVARCCVTGGLRCRVLAGPGPGRDAECVGTRQHLTGCSSRAAASMASSSMASASIASSSIASSSMASSSMASSSMASASRPRPGARRRCVVGDGATSHAVCCRAPALECNLMENISADEDEVEVSCPSGWTLTDCSAVSQGSAIVEPVAGGNSCRVRGATGAASVAVCCRVRPSPPEQPDTPPPH